MGFRIGIAVCVTVLAALAGRALGRGRIQRADALRALADDLNLLKEWTVFRLMPMADALDKLRLPAMRMTAEAMRSHGSVSAAVAWMGVSARERGSGGSLEWMSAEENGEISGLFEALSTLGRKEHESRYEQTVTRIFQKEAEERKAGKEKMKLYTSLGALAGLAAGVLLI